MNTNHWRKNRRVQKPKLFKVLGIFAMLAFVAFISYHLFLAVNIANEKLQILEVAQKDVAELRIQNLDLVLEKRDIVSMEYIEKEARDKLRYSREEEVLFVIPKSLLESEWVEQKLNEASGFEDDFEEKKPDEIFEIWKNFLIFEGV